MFYVLTADLEERTALIAHLREAASSRSSTTCRCIPRRSRAPRRAADESADDGRRSARLLRLPMYYDLSDAKSSEIARSVTEFYDCRRSVPQSQGPS